MKKVEQKALANMLALLESMGAQYRILDRDGKEYTNMPCAEECKPKRQSRAHLYLPYLDGIAVGDVVTVPYCDEVTSVQLQQIVAGYMKGRFGNGAHITARNDDGSIDVMRTN